MLENVAVRALDRLDHSLSRIVAKRLFRCD